MVVRVDVMVVVVVLVVTMAAAMIFPPLPVTSAKKGGPRAETVKTGHVLLGAPQGEATRRGNRGRRDENRQSTPARWRESLGGSIIQDGMRARARERK